MQQRWVGTVKGVGNRKSRKSEEPEIGTGSKVGTRKSEINFFRKSEGENVGSRKS